MRSNSSDSATKATVDEVLLSLVDLFPRQHPITAKWISQVVTTRKPIESDETKPPAPASQIKPVGGKAKNPFDSKAKPTTERAVETSAGSNAPIKPSTKNSAQSAKFPPSMREFTGTASTWSAAGRTSSNRGWTEILGRFDMISSRLSGFALKKMFEENVVGFQIMDIADRGIGQRVDVMAHKATSPGSDRVLISLHGSKLTRRYEVSIEDLSVDLIHDLVEIEIGHE